MSLDAVSIGLTPIAEGFDSPLLATNADDGSGRLFVVEQTGRVWVLRGANRSAPPFLDVSSKISAGGERGLLGLAFSPDYETSGIFYVDYTDRNGDTNVVRFRATDPASDSPTLVDRAVVLATLHDAPEALTGDLPRMVKALLPDGAKAQAEERAAKELLGAFPPVALEP